MWLFFSKRKGVILEILDIISLIVGIFVGIPIIAVIIFNWFVEGQALGAVMESFGIHPIIIAIIGIFGIIALIRGIANVLPF